jgi:hypothetical protein
MGTWGVGMQANDTALDEIGAAKDSGDPLKYLKDNIDKWLKDNGEYGNGRKSILGVADYCLDEKLPIDDVLKGKIKQAVMMARHNNTFREKRDRELALDRFVRRLDGRKVSKRSLAEDNAGLLSKICGVGLSRVTQDIASGRGSKGRGKDCRRG